MLNFGDGASLFASSELYLLWLTKERNIIVEPRSAAEDLSKSRNPQHSVPPISMANAKR